MRHVVVLDGEANFIAFAHVRDECGVESGSLIVKKVLATVAKGCVECLFHAVGNGVMPFDFGAQEHVLDVVLWSCINGRSYQIVLPKSLEVIIIWLDLLPIGRRCLSHLEGEGGCPLALLACLVVIDMADGVGHSVLA